MMTKEVHFESFEDLKAQLSALKHEEALSLNFPDKIVKSLQLSEYKIKSCENLFNNYLRSGAPEGSNFSLDQFIEYYADLVRSREEEFIDSVVSLVSDQVYGFMQENGFAARVVYHNKTLIIFRKPQL